MVIEKIEGMTLEDAKDIALETMEIKGHECVFVDFKDRFGYSVLVFKNKKHIHYADDYELHHEYIIQEDGREALRDFYIQEMNNKLFTDDELMEPVKTYDEYKRKDYFLRNYWIMGYDYLSIFGIGEEARRKFNESRPNFPYYSNISFCYVADPEIVDIQQKYSKNLETRLEALKNSDKTFREMISYELANHEACVTYDCTDALQALGYKWNDLSESQKRITHEELEKQYNRYGSDDGEDENIA